ncbi:MAG TPA: lactate utilization protein C [Nocardioidaceae bacterium]|nr:lactate utilization protein C [Nocardioidaceae bacterium]
MTAREDVLASVRRALAGADRTSPDVLRRYREAEPAGDLLELFVERVEDYRATVTRCPDSLVEQTIMEVIGERSVVVPAALPWTVSGAVIDDHLSASDLDDIEAVVTAAAAGIAVTGTIVLDHSPDQGRRVISLIPDLHVCVIRAEQVLLAVPDAFATLDPRRPQTWISGPSATSDIELQRVEGVHGPRNLHIVLVE